MAQGQFSAADVEQAPKGMFSAADIEDPASVHTSVNSPSEFLQTLRDHLFPSAAGVVGETVSAIKNTGPQGGTLPAQDTRIPEDAPFYGFRKTLLDLEDHAKAIYDKVTHPTSTLANDPVGVLADFGKLASSLKIARDMVEGKPATSLDLSAVKDKLKSLASKLPEVSPETRDVIGVVSPRAKNLLGVSQRLRDAAGGAPEAAAPVDPMLDKIAQGMGGKSFEALPPEGQATVRGIADKLAGNAPAAAKPATSTAPVEWRTPEEIAAAEKAATAPAATAPVKLQVYHATESAPFSKFEAGKMGSATDEGQLGKGAYFSTDPAVGRSSATLMPANVELKNPLRIDYPKWQADKTELINNALGTKDLSGQQLTKELLAKGHDGVILDYSPVGYHHQEVMVVDPSNVELGTPLKGAAPVPDLTTKLNNLKREWAIKMGDDPNLPLGEFKHGHYPVRFSGDDSPVINSGLRKAGSTAEVANPEKLVSITKFVDSLPDNSPLLGNPKALQAAYKLAIELKKTSSKVGIGDLMKQGRQ